MTLVTSQDFGKYFTDNDNISQGELVGLNIPRGCMNLQVTLRYSGGDVTISESHFLSKYKQAMIYPSKGAICECDVNGSETLLRYSDGKGIMFKDKQLTQRSATYRIYKSVKQISC